MKHLLNSAVVQAALLSRASMSRVLIQKWCVVTLATRGPECRSSLLSYVRARRWCVLEWPEPLPQLSFWLTLHRWVVGTLLWALLHWHIYKKHSILVTWNSAALRWAMQTTGKHSSFAPGRETHSGRSSVQSWEHHRRFSALLVLPPWYTLKPWDLCMIS